MGKRPDQAIFCFASHSNRERSLTGITIERLVRRPRPRPLIVPALRKEHVGHRPWGSDLWGISSNPSHLTSVGVSILSPMRSVMGLDFVLTIVDDCTREAPAIAVDVSRPGERVVLLDQVAAIRGLPKAIACCNRRPAVRGPNARAMGVRARRGAPVHSTGQVDSECLAVASTAESATSASTRAGS